jgi:thiosulfate/3-mercaptopyruvate sulfurtransferase
MHPLVSAAELAGSPGVVVADVRWYLDGRSGRAAYEEGHIPGAVFVDLDTVLAGPPGDRSRGRHPLPDPAAFAAALGALGVAADVPVVAYDDAGGATAARLWWMLRAIGQPSAVLDGGIGAWTGPLETGAGPRPTPVERPVRPCPPSALVSADDLPALVAGGALLVDARAPERYRGEVEPVDPKAGHIPGAVNLPWSDNLDPDTGRFLPPEVLRARFGDRGDVVSYCGSGVTACHNLLALEVAGLPAGRLYPGSWSEWSSGDRPVAT